MRYSKHIYSIIQRASSFQRVVIYIYLFINFLPFRHTIICEISQNVRYQYVFIILWFFFVIGVFVSILGFVQSLFATAKAIYWIFYSNPGGRESFSDSIHSQLTLREMQYLDKIRQMDMTMYGEVLRELTQFKPDIHVMKKYQSMTREVLLLPSAPMGQHVVWFLEAII